jgi:uncharacterized protein (TIGR02099 family)
MQNVLRKIIQTLAYFMAGVVIFLAVVVGLFRLLLPRLPEYQEEIKDWASTAVGMRVEFSGMNARWRFSGPELSFLAAELSSGQTSRRILTAEEVSVGVSLVRLLRDREFVVDRLVVRDSRLDVRQDESGAWQIQGMSFDELLKARSMSGAQAGDVLVFGEDIEIAYRHPGHTTPFFVEVPSLQIRRDAAQIAIDAVVELPDDFGRRLQVSASQRLLEADAGIWQVFVESDALELSAWSQLQPEGYPEVVSGRMDLSLWLELSNSGVRSTTANFDISDFATPDIPSSQAIDAEGRIEYSRSDNSWFLAASQFRMSTVEAVWPLSTWQLQVTTADNGRPESVRADATYISLDDLRYVAAWLPEQQREQIASFTPSGELLEAHLTLNGLHTESVRFEVAGELRDAGVAAQDPWPGLRGFSGRIRADSDGGRLEIDSSGLRVDLVAQLSETIELDDARGTIIWRQNNRGTTVLSDSVRIRNPDFDSESSLQLTLPADDSSPLIDLDSRWSVNDFSAIDRYLPAKLMHPQLYAWFTTALVSGNIPRGTTRLVGPLDKFPFDNGEGVFRSDARAENAVLRFAEQWPEVANLNLDVVLDGMRLYSHRNTAVSSGNSVRDAKVEIADLREPVLEIDAFATGTLQSILDYSSQSPIASLFGGQLDLVDVDGDASFNLELTYPIKDRENYEFSTRVQANDGTVRLRGFAPPLSELNGIVMITRDEIASESMFGTFLGETVDIALARSDDPFSPYDVIATATGRATAAGLNGELGAPLQGLIFGATGYTAEVMFPQPGIENSPPVRVAIESSLRGLEVAMPTPLAKSAGIDMPMSLLLDFSEPGRIESVGSLADDIRWTLAFEREDEVWDFDRGAIAVGGGEAELPGTRGLHIAGQTAFVHLEEWLDLARGGESTTAAMSAGTPIGDRIRSIDLSVERFVAVGQHMGRHDVVVDRGAQDWVVQIEGEHASGSIAVPYDLEGGRPLSLDMQRLTLMGSDEDVQGSDPETPRDPRALPAIAIAAEEFALGERQFGRLSADFVRTPNGLRASNLTTDDATFNFSGEAGWIIDNADQSGHRSYVQGKLLSSDIEQTMSRLNYEPGIVGNDMEIDLDIRWSGGPREDFLESLNGDVTVRFGAGQLNEVDPGPGRVFGLMSVVALPRRLSLDFSDVLDKGFGFDSITGTFNIVDGNAYTCDLSLKGPAADVGIVGRAGLGTRDYSQTALVSANVGNTLPVVGAVVAGPQVAAALLIFSQIFKKPLQEMSQIYYGIDGSWDEPSIDVATAVRFAQDSGLANCIDSPE